MSKIFICKPSPNVFYMAMPEFHLKDRFLTRSNLNPYGEMNPGCLFYTQYRRRLSISLSPLPQFLVGGFQEPTLLAEL